MFIIAPYAFIIAAVGLIESLLTLAILDEMSKTRGSGNRECVAQGVGNTLCGFFGAMPRFAIIDQFIINFTSGDLIKLSLATAAILVVIFVVSIPNIISPKSPS